MRAHITGSLLAATLIVGCARRPVDEPYVDTVQTEEGAVGPDYPAWDTLDANGDGRVEPSEFEGAIHANLYGTWDLDDDERLVAGEIMGGYYQTFDADGDGFLDYMEYEVPLFYELERVYGLRVLPGTDEVIDRDEFVVGFGELAWFDRWDDDGDGALEPDELTPELFRALDTDRSGFIEIDEWGL